MTPGSFIYFDDVSDCPEKEEKSAEKCCSIAELIHCIKEKIRSVWKRFFCREKVESVSRDVQVQVNVAVNYDSDTSEESRCP